MNYRKPTLEESVINPYFFEDPNVAIQEHVQMVNKARAAGQNSPAAQVINAVGGVAVGGASAYLGNLNGNPKKEKPDEGGEKPDTSIPVTPKPATPVYKIEEGYESGFSPLPMQEGSSPVSLPNNGMDYWNDLRIPGTFAFGGTAGQTGIEVEGQEVLETPGGQVSQVQGPSHEAGGVQMQAPIGTKVYSKRLKIKGKTMAERKKVREQKEAQISKRLSQQPTDAVTKATLKRIQQQNQMEEELDLQMQESFNEMENQQQTSIPQYGGGTGEDGTSEVPLWTLYSTTDKDYKAKQAAIHKKYENALKRIERKASQSPNKVYESGYYDWEDEIKKAKFDREEKLKKVKVEFENSTKSILDDPAVRQLQYFGHHVYPREEMVGSSNTDQNLAVWDQFRENDPIRNKIWGETNSRILMNNPEEILFNLGEGLRNLNPFSDESFEEKLKRRDKFHAEKQKEFNAVVKNKLKAFGIGKLTTEETEAAIKKLKQDLQRQSLQQSSHRVATSPANTVEQEQMLLLIGRLERNLAKGIVKNTTQSSVTGANPAISGEEIQQTPATSQTPATYSSQGNVRRQTTPVVRRPKIGTLTNASTYTGINADPTEALTASIINSDGFKADKPTISATQALTNIAKNPIAKPGGNTDKDKNFDFNMPSAGDMTGLLGTAFSSFAGLANTANARAADTPNINAFENYGQDALDTMYEQADFIRRSRDAARLKVKNRSLAQTNSARNTARGVNTLRALDLANYSKTNDALLSVDDSFMNQMAQNSSAIAGRQADNDLRRMSGRQMQDAADRADLDAFYTAKGKNLADVGEGIQRVGKMFNQSKYNKDTVKAIGEGSQYFVYDADGNLVSK